MKDNIIKSLIIMGKGMFSIFLVITVIVVITYVLVHFDKRKTEQERLKALKAEASENVEASSTEE